MRSRHLLADPDPNHLMDGLKWNFTSGVAGDELDAVGEYDYFWFSAPTDVDIETAWSIKAGQNIATGMTRGPECPDCPPPGIPEPMSLVLFGTGLAAFINTKRRKSTHT